MHFMVNIFIMEEKLVNYLEDPLEDKTIFTSPTASPRGEQQPPNWLGNNGFIDGTLSSPR